MAEVSKNSMDFIKASGEKVKGKFGKAFLGTLIMVAPLMLCVFSVYALPLAILFFGVFDTGYIRFMKALINGENPSYKLIFSEFKTPWVEIFLGAIMLCMFVVGTVLAIIPGVILIAYYSMSLFVAEHDKINDVGMALKESSKKMNGNISSMFAYKTFFWLFYIILLFISVILGVLGLKLWADHAVLTIIIIALDYLFTTVVWSVITVFYHAANQIFFAETLTYQEIKKSRKASQKVEIINEAKEEEVKVETEEKVVEEEPKKKVAPKTAKKPATKSTTTKKTTKK